MRSLSRWVAIGHVGWGMLLLLAAGWFTVSAFRTLPYMSAGARDLPAVLMVAAMNALPLAALGAWMLILGRGLWSGRRDLRAPLLWTHGVLAALGALSVAVGVYALGAAERSSARGGGLLAPIAILPLLFGVPVVLLALSTIIVARKRESRS
jgi:hypothetical protein